jgi:hypothetical protein
MIAAKIVTEVRQLLDEGTLSQRKIAQRMGISRGSVGAIAAGKRPDYEAMGQPREDEWEEPAGPPARCPGCGGKVYMPCRLCRTRQAIDENARSTSQRHNVEIDVPLGLNLRPEHRARFEEVCEWRRKLADVPSAAKQ